MTATSHSLTAFLLLGALNLRADVTVPCAYLSEMDATETLVSNDHRDLLIPIIKRGANVTMISIEGPSAGSGILGHGMSANSFMRDQMPLTIVKNHKLTMVRYLSPLSKGEYVYAGIRFDVPANKGSLAFGTSKKFSVLPVVHLPLWMEGSNIIHTQRHLYIGEKVFWQNSLSPKDLVRVLAQGKQPTKEIYKIVETMQKGIGGNGYQPRSRQEILELLSLTFNVSLENIKIVRWLPGEKSGHIDMIMSFLTLAEGDRVKEVFFVPYIPDYALKVTGLDFEFKFAEGINRRFQEEADSRSKESYEVVRVPMLPPRNLEPSTMSALHFDAHFPTTTNWLVDGKTRTVLVPVFSYHDLAVVERMKSEITALLNRFRLTPEFANADNLLAVEGLFHCISGQLCLP